MARVYEGLLAQDDPLYEYLKNEIQPQLSDWDDAPAYNVYNLNGSNAVYLYEEIHSGTKMIGKYFLCDKEPVRESAARRMNREYDNLAMMRSYGFDKSPYYVAKPLGRNDDLNELLVVECCEGELLSSVIDRTIEEGDDALLFDKLAALGHFFAAFHNCTAFDEPVDFTFGYNYMGRVIEQASAMFDEGDAEEFEELRNIWRERSEMWEDNRVMVHGDATTANFMFGDDENVCTFDFERVMPADRIFDMGRMAGELMHSFLLGTGDKYAAEPFIGHFLWEYSTRFPDREATFASITKRIPYYMGTTLLRISRNDYLEPDYRRRLIYEAKNCLKESEE